MTLDDNNTTSDILIDTLKETRSKNPNNIIISHVNVNSIKNNFFYFQDVLLKGLLDILCITETKLDETYLDSIFHCNGYKCYRKDRNARSGGLMVLIRDDIAHTRMPKYEMTDNETHIESMVFEIVHEKLSFFVIVTYKNPKVENGKFITSISEIYKQISKNNKDSILLGDINIDMSNANNEFTQSICNIYDLTNIISKPTCHKAVRGSLIDPIIVSNTHNFFKPFNVTCGSSDFHNMVGCVIRTAYPKTKPFKLEYRSYKSFNDNMFKRDIDNMPAQICEIFDDVDDQYWAFNWMYNEILNEHAPMKSKTVTRQKVPYMSSNLMRQIYIRNNLKNKFYKYRSKENWEAYRVQRNKVVNLRRLAINEYFINEVRKRKSSPKDFWNTFKPFISQKSSQNQGAITLRENEIIVNDEKSVCNILNNYFITMADEITSNTENKNTSQDADRSLEVIKNLIHDDNKQFEFENVDITLVTKKLKNINSKKSAGFDGIPPKMVKLCCVEIAPALTNIINKSFRTNTFPHDMKKAEICPIYKKKCTLSKENYRPINLVGIFSKTVESIIAEQIESYMNIYFNDLLGAYRKGHGCSQVLTYAVDTWKKALDKDESVVALFMDLSKAFDSIPHELLLKKLDSYGFSQNACLFMSSYLTHRQQRVRIRNNKSEWATTKKGIPQGSCLGPILFNIFINDLFPHVLNCNVFNYADDNSLSASNSCIDVAIDNVIKDANIAIKWFHDNFMKVNPDKFQIMFLTPAYKAIKYPSEVRLYDQCTLTPMTEVKLLGITIDNQLHFDYHVNTLCKKASKMLKILYRFKKVFGLKERGIMVNTFILSCFNFCPIVWHFCGKQSSKLIEKIQERALRFLTNDYESPYYKLLEITKRSTMHVERLRMIAIEIFKCVNKINPNFVNNIIAKKEIDKDLRDPCLLEVPRFHKINYGKKTISYYGPHIWNLLPFNLKQSMSLSEFKKIINKWDEPSCQCSLCKL